MSEIYLVEADENGEILDAELIDDNFDSTAEYAEDDEEEYEDDEEEYEELDKVVVIGQEILKKLKP